MENHIKALSFPTWAERLTAFQRPERGCVFFTPKTRTETDIVPEARDLLTIQKRMCGSWFRGGPHVVAQ